MIQPDKKQRLQHYYKKISLLAFRIILCFMLAKMLLRLEPQTNHILDIVALVVVFFIYLIRGYLQYKISNSLAGFLSLGLVLLLSLAAIVYYFYWA